MARNKRSLDWDYSILHRTGERVLISRKHSAVDIMDGTGKDSAATNETVVATNPKFLIHNEE